MDCRQQLSAANTLAPINTRIQRLSLLFNRLGPGTNKSRLLPGETELLFYIFAPGRSSELNALPDICDATNLVGRYQLWLGRPGSGSVVEAGAPLLPFTLPPSRRLVRIDLTSEAKESWGRAEPLEAGSGATAGVVWV